MELSKVQTGLRLDDFLHEKVKAIAKKERRSANNMMEYFIAKGVESYEVQNGEIILPEE
jgi:predicted transcriptional regulator